MREGTSRDPLLHSGWRVSGVFRDRATFGQVSVANKSVSVVVPTDAPRVQKNRRNMGLSQCSPLSGFIRSLFVAHNDRARDAGGIRSSTIGLPTRPTFGSELNQAWCGRCSGEVPQPARPHMLGNGAGPRCEH